MIYWKKKIKKKTKLDFYLDLVQVNVDVNDRRLDLGTKEKDLMRFI